MTSCSSDNIIQLFSNPLTHSKYYVVRSGVIWRFTFTCASLRSPDRSPFYHDTFWSRSVYVDRSTLLPYSILVTSFVVVVRRCSDPHDHVWFVLVGVVRPFRLRSPHYDHGRFLHVYDFTFYKFLYISYVTLFVYVWCRSLRWSFVWFVCVYFDLRCRWEIWFGGPFYTLIHSSLLLIRLFDTISVVIRRWWSTNRFRWFPFPRCCSFWTTFPRYTRSSFRCSLICCLIVVVPHVSFISLFVPTFVVELIYKDSISLFVTLRWIVSRLPLPPRFSHSFRPLPTTLLTKCSHFTFCLEPRSPRWSGGEFDGVSRSSVKTRFWSRHIFRHIPWYSFIPTLMTDLLLMLVFIVDSRWLLREGATMVSFDLFVDDSE